MKTKSMKVKTLAFTLVAVTAFGSTVPALAGTAKAAEVRTVTEETTDTDTVTGQAVSYETQPEEATGYTVPSEETNTESQLETNATNNKGDVVITGVDEEPGGGTDTKGDYSNPVTQKAFELAKEAGMNALEKGIDMLFDKVPFIDMFLPSIKDDLKELIGIGSGDKVSTKEVMDRINSLEENMNKAIDDQTRTLIKSMGDAFTVGSYKKEMQKLATSVKIRNAVNTTSPNFSEEDRLVQLAMIAGDSENWDTDGKFIHQLIMVGQALIGKNYEDDRSMFSMLIEVNKKNYQFSGEVVDAVNPYVVKLMTDYLKYTSLALSSLTAQQMIISDSFDESEITNKQILAQYKTFRNVDTSIEGTKAMIESMVFGSKVFEENGVQVDSAEGYDNVLDSYKVFQNHPRNIHIPTGKTPSLLLRTVQPYELIDDNKQKTTDWGEGHFESTNKKDFENRVQGGTGVSNNGNNNIFTAKEMRDIFTHVQKVVKEKRQSDPGYTAWKFFTELGFFTSKEVTDLHRFIIGDNYDEVNYDFSMEGSKWDTYFDTASILTGEISNTFWKHMVNYVGQLQTARGNQAYYHDYLENRGGYIYLFFRPGTARNPESCLTEPVLNIKGPKM